MATYNLSPSKEAYQAIKADVTPVSAFKELVDNALDNWQRVLKGLDPLDIEIEYWPEGPDQEERIVIRDDSGGVEEEDVKILFALGMTKKEKISGAIGAYGVGAKKAIINLGNEATIKSRHVDAEKGFGFHIDEDWLRDDTDWSVEKVEYDDVEEGVTEITIRDLNNSWDRYRGNLVEDLQDTYQYFLDPERDDGRESIDIIVREYDRSGDVAEEEYIEAAGGIDWSFTPMDGLFPRRYEDIELLSKDFDYTVKMHVTVGLLREADAANAGADIYCQGRKVLSAVRDDRAAFGTGAGSSRLGKYSGQHRRLKFVIEFETDGDGKDLPWDAQKSDIDPYNRVSQAAQDWVRRIVKPYYTAAGAYDEIPSAVLSPYDRDNPYAVTDFLEDPYDYGGERERVSHKPDTDFGDAAAISDRADVTAALRAYSPGDLDDALVPAYRSELARLLAADHDMDVDAADLPTAYVPEADVPGDMSLPAARSTSTEMERLATKHASQDPPVRSSGMPGWQQALYDRNLREALEERDIDADLDDLEDAEEEAEGLQFEPDDGDGPTGNDGDDTDIGAGQDDIDEDTDDDESEGRGAPEGDDDEADNGATDDEGPDDISPDLTPGDTDDARRLELTDDEWDRLVEALGLPEDADPEEVTEELLDVLEIVGRLKA